MLKPGNLTAREIAQVVNEGAVAATPVAEAAAGRSTVEEVESLR